MGIDPGTNFMGYAILRPAGPKNCISHEVCTGVYPHD